MRIAVRRFGSRTIAIVAIATASDQFHYRSSDPPHDVDSAIGRQSRNRFPGSNPNGAGTDPDQEDHYSLLGVPFTATHAEITRAYRQAMKRAHPDRQLPERRWPPSILPDDSTRPTRSCPTHSSVRRTTVRSGNR